MVLPVLAAVPLSVPACVELLAGVIALVRLCPKGLAAPPLTGLILALTFMD